MMRNPAGRVASGRIEMKRSERNRYIFGASVVPPAFSHVPLATYFHSLLSLSVLAPKPAHACFAVPQSFCPPLAMP